MPPKTVRILALLLVALLLAVGRTTAAEFTLEPVPRGLVVPDGRLTDWPDSSFRPLTGTDTKNPPLWASAYDGVFLHFALKVSDSTPEFNDYLHPDFLTNDTVLLLLEGRESFEFSITYLAQPGRTLVFPPVPWLAATLLPSKTGYTVEISLAVHRLGGLKETGSIRVQLVVLDVSQGILEKVYTLSGSETLWRDSADFSTLALKT
ncbi:MAG: hypothetical protein H0Z38_05545 [Firmicutes bacterium]|nr:hypothetical protein [Bacillota bacterium]